MKILSVVCAPRIYPSHACQPRYLCRSPGNIGAYRAALRLRMSQTFFDELDIPVPDYNLAVGSGSQSRQTAETMVRMEEVLLKEKPDLVSIRGDTNSTLAATLVTSKLNIPLAHIEAGERSFNRSMPEEINRLVSDRLADLHFCVTQTGMHNLATEGIADSVHWVGDVMLDALLYAQPTARTRSNILGNCKLNREIMRL